MLISHVYYFDSIIIIVNESAKIHASYTATLGLHMH